MSPRGILSGPVIAGSGVLLLARIRTSGGDLLNQASVSGIAWTLTDVTNGVPVSSGTFAAGATVFNSLQQGDVRWTQDSQRNPGPDGLWGYNFGATIPASAVPLTPQTPAGVQAPAPRYQVDVAFSLASGEPFRAVWQFRPVAVFG